MVTRNPSRILRLAGMSLATLAVTILAHSAALADDSKPTPKKAAKKAAKKAQNALPFLGVFRDLDTNSDNVIDRQEIPESGRKAFDAILKHADTNHDEKIQAEEYRALMTKVKADEAKADPKVTADAEATADAKVSADPKVMPDAKATAEAKATADPKVTADPTARRQALRERLKIMDKDGDGRISRAEFTGRSKQFDRLDANQDGYLDKADVKQAKQGKVGKAKSKAKSAS